MVGILGSVLEVVVSLIASVLTLGRWRILRGELPNFLSGASQLRPDAGYKRPGADGFADIVVGTEEQGPLQ
jgi:hypothetical protein